MSLPPILVLSTEERDYAFDLLETFRIAIGRHESNDVRLPSRTVSNYHAEILNDGERIEIRDLRSANGTIVNGEPVGQRRLASGDVVTIGGYRIAVRLDARRAPATEEGAVAVAERGRLLSREKTTATADALTLEGLVRALARGRRSARVALHRDPDRAVLLVEGGRVVHAECGHARGEKAFYRLMGWEEGAFELGPLPRAVHRSISLPVETLLAQARERAAETERIAGFLPPPDRPLRLNETSDVPPSALSAAELEVFQAIIRHGTIARVLDACPYPDFRILELVHALLRKKVFVVAGGRGEVLLEKTSIFLPGRAPRPLGESGS